MHRGFKEADIILGSFAEQHLPDFTEDEIEPLRRSARGAGY